MGRLGIRIANVALFTLCCFQAAAVFNKVSADLLMPSPSAFAASPVPAALAARSWEQRQPILERNLFGAQMFADPLPEEEPEVEDLAATKLPVRLLGTQVHSVRENSKAAITDKGGRFHELLYVGDALERHPEARLVKIERGRVILLNEGRREELLLVEAATEPVTKRTDRRRRSRRSARSEAAVPAPLTERLRELQLGKNEGRSARDLFSQAKIIPKWDDGQMVGMELREIEPGSLYEKVGLSEGDIITSFNGVALDSAAAGARVLSQFVEADEFKIGLIGGEVMTVGSEELAELLGSDGDE
jgi:type II secretion system protein C